MSKELLGSLELNRIYQLDVLDGLKLIPNNSVDLVICDPPYGIDFNSNRRKNSTLKTTKGIANDKDNTLFLEEVIDELNRVLKDNSHIYWFTRWDKVSEQKPLLDKHFKVKNSLIWMKNNWSMGDLFGAYAGQYENILFAQKGRKLLNEVDGTKRHPDILQYDRVPPSELLHSHQKPLDLLEFIIKKSSQEGDIVLVPFCGSGSECVASKILKRKFLSFELEREFIETANKRLDCVEDSPCSDE